MLANCIRAAIVPTWLCSRTRRPSDWGWHVVHESIAAYAANFYEDLRQVDRRGLLHIFCQRVPESGTGAALSDRMQRAAER